MFAVMAILVLAAGCGWWWNKRRLERLATAARVEARVAEADAVISRGTDLTVDLFPLTGRWRAAQNDEASQLHQTRDAMLSDFAAALDDAVKLAGQAPAESVHLRWKQAGDLALALLRLPEAEKYYRLANADEWRITQPTEWTAAQERIATVLHLQSRWDDELHLRAVIRVEAMGKMGADPLPPESIIRLGIVCVRLRRTVEAQEDLTSALRQLEKRFGPDSPELLRALDPLAEMRIALGETKKAEEILQRAGEIAEKNFGPDDYRTATQISYKGDALRSQGRNAEAAELYQQAIEKSEKSRGHKDFYAADFTWLAALSLGQQKRWPEAEAKLNESLDMLEDTLPKDDPFIGHNLAELAACIQSEGRLADAERDYRGAMDILDRTEPDATFEAIDYRVGFAVLLSDIGKYSEAETLFRRALEAMAKRAGTNDRRYASIQLKLAELLQRTGKTEAAAALNKEGGKALESVPVGPGVSEAAGLSERGLIALNARDYLQAETLLRQALAIDDGKTDRDLELSTILNNLGLTLQNVGRFTESERYLRRALDLDLKIYGPDHVNVADVMLNIAANYKQRGHSQEALPLARRAVDIYEIHYGKENPKVAIGLNDVAAMLVDLQRWDEAEELQRRAVAIDEKNAGLESEDVIARLNYLSYILEKAQEFSKAEPVLRRLMKIAVDDSKSATPHPALIKNCTMRYTRCLQSLGQSQEAIDDRCARLRRGETVPDL
jgi:tetratricopeptide (TPR) repeat protein